MGAVMRRSKRSNPQSAKRMNEWVHYHYGKTKLGMAYTQTEAIEAAKRIGCSSKDVSGPHSSLGYCKSCSTRLSLTQS